MLSTLTGSSVCRLIGMGEKDNFHIATTGLEDLTWYLFRPLDSEKRNSQAVHDAEKGKEAKLKEKQPGTDLETAVEATGYGRFHWYIFFSVLPAYLGAIFTVAADSYIYDAAKCDLAISLVDMGTINAAVFVGMTFSAPLWGYLSDTTGRKKIIVWGFLGSSLCLFASGLSQNFAMLIVIKFFAGFIFNGPFSTVMSYVSEMHQKEMRLRVLSGVCLFYTLGSTLLPLLAWGVLSLRVKWTLFGGWIVIKPWNLYLGMTGFVPAMASLVYSLLPESPRFLASQGRQEEALQVLRRMYATNTGNRPDDYPITKLVEAKQESGASVRLGFRQMAPLFRPPYLPYLVILCALYSGNMFSLNIPRTWFPQLATAMQYNNGATNASTLHAFFDSHLGLVEGVNQTTVNGTVSCLPYTPVISTYTHSMVVGAGTIITYSAGALLRGASARHLASTTLALAAACCATLPFMPASFSALTALIAAAVALVALAGTALSSIAVDMFPTSMRAMAVSLFMMSGRVGSVLGNVVFPLLLECGLAYAFFVLAAVMIACAITALLIPKSSLDDNE